MTAQLEDSRPIIRRSIARERDLLGHSGILRILDEGRKLTLPPVLAGGGGLLFPHTFLARCGHQVAACVHALLDSGADQALIIGVLHASGHLGEASLRVAGGSDRFCEPTYGIQGPGLPGRADWMEEFSLHNFCYLLELEARRRGVALPRLAIRYPLLVGERPEDLPGVEELEALAKDSALLVTGDLFHHGSGYGPVTDGFTGADPKGLVLARGEIESALRALEEANFIDFLTCSMRAHSDWDDVGPLLRHLVGPCKAQILDLTWADTSVYYSSSPNWVAASLIAFEPATGL